jgi:hypothetical protein
MTRSVKENTDKEREREREKDRFVFIQNSLDSARSVRLLYTRNKRYPSIFWNRKETHSNPHTHTHTHTHTENKSEWKSRKKKIREGRRRRKGDDDGDERHREYEANWSFGASTNHHQPTKHRCAPCYSLCGNSRLSVAANPYLHSALHCPSSFNRGSSTWGKPEPLLLSPADERWMDLERRSVSCFSLSLSLPVLLL